MIAPDIQTAVLALRELIEEARVIVPFTGAGISTECGIPDFRSPGGIWTKMRPIEFADFLANQEARDALYNSGKSPGLITQNIDNLHQASGIASEHVIELHGNTTYATCLDCAARYDLPWVRARFEADSRAPACTSCGGFIKTATVSFGQSMPEAAMRRAEELTLRADLYIAIGSSLVVWPAAGFPVLAKRNGARLVIINRDETEFDDIADLVLRQDIGAVLEPFIAA